MLQELLALQNRVAHVLGHVKFAVAIILIFAVALIYGTFMESYHGADYANRLVYKSLPFMVLQGLMFLSILVATLQRLPYKKRLAGFYVLHLGLLILFLGSFITYQAGVDGNMTLAPNTPSARVDLNEDRLTVQFPEDKKEITLELPYVARERQLDFSWNDIELKRFLPFAEEEVQWEEDKLTDPRRGHSSQYRLKNDNFSEELTLSLHPQADFESTASLGPLNVHYMPELLAECFGRPSYEGLLIWDAREGHCLTPQEKDLRKTRGVTGKKLISLDYQGQQLNFLPELSPLPVDRDLKLVENSAYRIFSRRLFEEKPHLFVFGKHVAFFDRELKSWQLRSLSAGPVALPWMGFELTLLRHEGFSYPVRRPVAVTPIQDNGQLIYGKLRAVEVRVGRTQFWVTNERAMSLDRKNGPVVFQLGRRDLKLPFEITLDQFKMDTDPGTNSPASYESFVSLFEGNRGSQKHHVFMNHPLKHDAFTFYQASYFQTKEGPFGSVFSVNFDPGRPWKYLGSLLLVLGSIWHFVLRRRPTKAQESL